MNNNGWGGFGTTDKFLWVRGVLLIETRLPYTTKEALKICPSMTCCCGKENIFKPFNVLKEITTYSCVSCGRKILSDMSPPAEDQIRIYASK